MSETVKAQAEDRTPMALLPYQQAWCADQSPVKLCEKSRRIGLSWGEAADTALLAGVAEGARDPAKLIEAFRSAIPLGRLGQGDDLASAIAFFGSDDAGFVTGQVLSVSGGLTMHG